MTRVAARGASLPAAFTELATAMLRLIADPAGLEEREVREVRAHGATPKDLLERFVDEILYVCEVEGFTPRRVELVVWSGSADGEGGEPLRLHAMLHGARLDPGGSGASPAIVVRDPARPVAIHRSEDTYEVSVELT